jgi:hypothetical protein
VIVEPRTNKTRKTANGDQGLAPRDVRRWLTMLLGGIGLGLGLVSYGVYGLISGHTTLPSGSRFFPGHHLDVHGPAVAPLAIAYIALGVFVHVHLFWEAFPRLSSLCAVVKVAAVLLFAGGVGLGIYRILVLGF